MSLVASDVFAVFAVLVVVVVCGFKKGMTVVTERAHAAAMRMSRQGPMNEMTGSCTLTYCGWRAAVRQGGSGAGHLNTLMSVNALHTKTVNALYTNMVHNIHTNLNMLIKVLYHISKTQHGTQQTYQSKHVCQGSAGLS